MVCSVNRVSVTDAHPRFQALGNDSVDNPVEPFKIIYAFLLLASCPTALDTGIGYSQFRKVVLIAIKKAVVPVKALSTDRPAGIELCRISIGIEFTYF